MTASEVTVCIPTHSARIRNGMLDRAIRSVLAQTRLPDHLSIATDTGNEGAAHVRQRALDGAKTRYVAFLDSDDEMLPNHIQALTDVAKGLDAAFVFSWFEPVGMADPLGHFGLPFNPHTPHHTTMTVLCRTDLAQEIGFEPAPAGSKVGNEDWIFILKFCQLAIERGLIMTHLAERTWRYHYHGLNTSGLPYKGDAA
jgi:glycosyltransferase involved in cell wall biosynthesis